MSRVANSPPVEASGYLRLPRLRAHLLDRGRSRRTCHRRTIATPKSGLEQPIGSFTSVGARFRSDGRRYLPTEAFEDCNAQGDIDFIVPILDVSLRAPHVAQNRLRASEHDVFERIDEGNLRSDDHKPSPNRWFRRFLNTSIDITFV